ncbi:MAG: hypothetical protein IKW14_03235 [Phascolarctobacterium sp.]|nr:hypothetical protein [Phascolarctobacterium sp.]
MEQRIEVIQEGNGLAIEKELTNREKYLAKMGKRERLIRKQIKSLKKHMQNAKFFVNVLDFADERIRKDARLDAECARIAIKVLRKELSKDRIKGVPVVRDDAEFGDGELHCKACWWTVADKDQNYTINYCPNCGRRIDWTGWV